MSVAVRVIPCLDVDAGRVVKGVRFVDHWDAGDPVELARFYAEEGADEVTFLDIGASAQERETLHEVVWASAGEVFVPLTVGGGVRTESDVDKLLRIGADKTAVNTAALARPALIGELASRFGSQCIVVSADVRRCVDTTTASGFEVTTHAGTRGTGVDALDWVQRAQEFGSGEILLNSMDLDGTRAGFDVELIRAVRAICDVPLIASGGAGDVAHFVQAAEAGADAVLGASVFHRRTIRIGQVKAALAAAGFPTRLPTAS